MTKPNGQGITGLLKKGAFIQKAHVSELPNATATHTATSFFRYSPKTGKLQWGTSKLGVEHPTGSRSTGSTTLRIGGSSDSVIVYQSSSGTGYFSTLVNGKLTAIGALSGFSSGWQIIAGGK